MNNLNSTDDRDLTRLHRACKDHNYEEVHKLLCNDASIFATDNDGCTPLHCACEGGDKRIVELLIQKSADNLKVPISDDPYVKSKIKQFINCTDYNEVRDTYMINNNYNNNNNNNCYYYIIIITM